MFIKPWLLAIALLILLMLMSPAAAQNSVSKTASGSFVTMALSPVGVRFTASGEVVRMQLQVLSESGQVLFEVSCKGNVLDWTLQDSSGARLTPGSYLCVVTIKSVSGKLTQKTGSISVEDQNITLHRAYSTKLTAAQQQTIGPLEDDSVLTIINEEDGVATTAIANNGTEGQIIRFRGALTFRLGDFFSGTDQEQMRLTEDGNLGVGTSNPLAKLDVAGTIRARHGLEFANGTRLTTSTSGRLEQTLVDGTALPTASGTGTQNRIAKWTDNAGTLGDSTIFENVNGNLGVGTVTPGARFHVIGTQGNMAAGTFQLDTPTLFSSFTGAYPAFEILNSNLTNNNVSLFQFSDAPSGASHAGIGAVNTNHINKFGNLFFFTKQSDGYQARMGIYGTNVGIGTVNPVAKLDVAGNVNTSTDYSIGGNRVLTVTGAPLFSSSNTFTGVGAGAMNTPATNNPNGNRNSFYGNNAGRANTVGTVNAFFGFGAGISNISGSTNSFFGSEAGESNTSGSQNAYFGYLAGDNNNGGGNSFFGVFAGLGSASDSNGTLVGASSSMANSLENATALGAHALVTQSNSLVLGSIKNMNQALDDTNVGIGTTAPQARLDIAVNSGHIVLGDAGCNPGFTGIGFGATISGCANFSLLGDGTDTVINRPTGGVISVREGNIAQFGIAAGGIVSINTLASGNTIQLCRNSSGQISNCSSSLRYKTHIAPYFGGLNIINRLRPISFSWKQDGVHDIGLGAEEVAKVEPLLTFRNQDGEIEGIKYNQLSVLFVNALKEQQQEIASQHKAIATLRRANAQLADRLLVLEGAMRRTHNRGVRRRR